MTVEPGKGGQKLIDSTVGKIKNVANYIKDNQLEVLIEADGGINVDNVEMLKNAGAEIIVSGTGIINSENYADIIKKMKE